MKKKVKMSLVSPTFLEGIAEAVEVCQEKFQEKMNKNEIIDNLMENILSIQKGEKINPNSGLEYWKHAASALMFFSLIEEKDKKDEKNEKLNINELLLKPINQPINQSINQPIKEDFSDKKFFNKKEIKKFIQIYCDKNYIPSHDRGNIFNNHINELKKYKNEEEINQQIDIIFRNH